jgi:hypothetical protein
MSENRKTVTPVWKEPEENLPNFEIKAQNDSQHLSPSPLSPAERYLKRKIEVTEQDHQEFLAYLEAKRAREAENQKDESTSEQPASVSVKFAPSKLDRRSFLTVVAGTAAVGEAAALGYTIVKDQAIPAHGASLIPKPILAGEVLAIGFF